MEQKQTPSQTAIWTKTPRICAAQARPLESRLEPDSTYIQTTLAAKPPGVSHANAVECAVNDPKQINQSRNANHNKQDNQNRARHGKPNRYSTAKCLGRVFKARWNGLKGLEPMPLRRTPRGRARRPGVVNGELRTPVKRSLARRSWRPRITRTSRADNTIQAATQHSVKPLIVHYPPGAGRGSSALRAYSAFAVRCNAWSARGRRGASPA